MRYSFLMLAGIRKYRNLQLLLGSEETTAQRILLRAMIIAMTVIEIFRSLTKSGENKRKFQEFAR